MAASSATVEIVATLRDQVTGSMRGIVGGIRSAFTGLRGLLGGLTAGAFFAGVKGVAEMEAALLRMARTTRSSVEDVSALRFALDDLSIGSSQLKGILDQIEGKRADALRGGGAARTAFGRLGVDLAELQDLGAVDLLRQIGDGYLAAGQSALAAAQLQAIFGDRFRELLPLLSQGSKGFEQLRQKAGALGALVSTQDAQAAARFAAVYTEFATVATGLFRDLANKILPELTSLLTGLRNLLTQPAQSREQLLQGFLDEGAQFLQEDVPQRFSDEMIQAFREIGAGFDRVSSNEIIIFDKEDTVARAKAALAEIRKEVERSNEQLKAEPLQVAPGSFFSGFAGEIEAMRLALEDLAAQGQKFARELNDAFVGSVTGALRDLRNGAIETRDVLSAMLDGFIEDLTEIATRRLTEQIFNSLLSWGTGLFAGAGTTPTGGGGGAPPTAGAQLAGGTLGRRRLAGNFLGPSASGGGGTTINMSSNASAEEQRALVSAIMRHEASRNRQVRTTFRLV